MTKRLYYEDSHIKEFPAVVTECRRGKNEWLIRLDQTAFFPEGGGQSGDSGFLNDIPVFDTQEEDGEVWHYTGAPLETGTAVTGCIDWDKRFSRMQQHSGEHIVSGLIHQRFGYDNVGFHLGEQEVTLDFNGSISREELAEIELHANAAVYANLPVSAEFPGKEELASLAYRSKIEIDGPVRIVSIPDIDVCACCAPHVHRTGEIGIIRLLNVQSHRGGVRIHMLAGGRALADCRKKDASVRAVSILLSAKEEEIANAVERLKKENFDLTGELMGLRMKLIQEKASHVLEGSLHPVFFETTLNPEACREFVNLLTARCCGIACVFTGNDADGYRYILGSKDTDTRILCRHLNSLFQGKGGGKPEMVQGSLTGTEKEITLAVRSFLS